MAQMGESELAAFLAETRLAVLTTLRDDGSPVAVPVWFEWDGDVARMFSGWRAGKTHRLQRDARATLLVPNHVDELERWVAFDGEVAIRDHGGFELADRMAQRYWDMERPERRAELESWRKMASHLRLLELRPTVVRSWKG